MPNASTLIPIIIVKLLHNGTSVRTMANQKHSSVQWTMNMLNLSRCRRRFICLCIWKRVQLNWHQWVCLTRELHTLKDRERGRQIRKALKLNANEERNRSTNTHQLMIISSICRCKYILFYFLLGTFRCVRLAVLFTLFTSVTREREVEIRYGSWINKHVELQRRKSQHMNTQSLGIILCTIDCWLSMSERNRQQNRWQWQWQWHHVHWISIEMIFPSAFRILYKMRAPNICEYSIFLLHSP